MRSDDVERTSAEVKWWAPTLPADRAKDAVTAARNVAARIADPVQVMEANAAAAKQTQFPKSVNWEPSSVAQGDAGLALLFGYLDQCCPDAGWDRVAHHHLTLAVMSSERAPGTLSAGLYSGLAGLAFVATELSRDGTRYHQLLTGLHHSLLASADRASAEVRSGRGLPVWSFDLISGLTGIGTYLISTGQVQHQLTSETDRAIGSVLTALVALTSDEESVPRWHTPVWALGDETLAAIYPDGNLNCGLAHGIPGPLALMALAMIQDRSVAGLASAVRHTAHWLASHRSDDEWGVNWPSMVPLPSTSEQACSARAAWCYGSPGIARTMWLSGLALDEPELQDLAIEAMSAVYRRPIVERRIDSPTFCHGVAGLLQVTMRFAHDTNLDIFQQATNDLTTQLLLAYDPGRALGFACTEAGGQLVDQPGLLDGAAGVALTLLAATSEVEPSWDRLFLLA